MGLIVIQQNVNFVYLLEALAACKCFVSWPLEVCTPLVPWGFCHVFSGNSSGDKQWIFNLILYWSRAQ